MLEALRNTWHGKPKILYTNVETGSNHAMPENISLTEKRPIAKEAGLHTRQRLHTGWNPPFLRSWPLLAFALFFTVVLVALQIIFSLSQRNQGISTTDGGKYYLWTYGPTALFVLTTVLWRQVDYAAKSIQPWAELANGPKVADETLLLDYVTPFQPVAAYRAFRKKHFTVFATIIVFFLIKVLTIVSTGIFTLRSIQEENETTVMVLQTTFDGTASEQYDAVSVDSRATFIVYGNIAYNINVPAGTMNYFAAQSFLPQGNEKNGSLTYSADVDVFHADLLCESGALTYNDAFSLANGNTPVASFYNTTVVTSDCEVEGAVLDAPDWYFVQDNSTRFGYYASSQMVTCSNRVDDDPRKYRYMIAAAYSEGFSQNNNTLLNSSNIVCSPTYEVQPGKVTIDISGNIQNILLSDTSPRQIPGITNVTIAKGILDSTRASSSLYVSNSDMVLDVFTNLLSQASPDFKPEDLLNASFLEEHSRNLYGKLAAQFANLYLLSSTHSSQPTIEGFASLTRNRLFVVETPIRWMQGIAAFTILSILVVILIRPQNVVPRSIDSITAIAAILARSPELENELRGSGHFNLEKLRQTLEGNRYMTVMNSLDGDKTFSIQKVGNTLESAQEVQKEDKTLANVSWIRPLILHRFAILTTMALAAAAIVASEVLLFESNKNDGLTNVSNNTTSRYSWLYIPILCFVLLGTLFNVMDFEIEFSESYHALSRGFCDASSSVLSNPLRNISVHTSWRGLKHGRLALTASSMSAILAPFLTIVVTGLFHTTTSQHNQPVTADAMDFFNLSGTYNPNNVIPALVIEGNMSYPKWTYDELALPRLEVNLQGPDKITTDGMISIDVPAVRARVECSVFPPHQIIGTTFAYGDTLSVNISTPDGCGNTGYLDNPNEFLSMDIDVPDGGSGYFGYTTAIGFKPSCPTIAIFYGRISADQLENFNAFACTQSLERLNVNATFSEADMSISSVYPPQPYENSKTFFSPYYDAFPQLQNLNITTSNVSTSSKFDSIVNTMIYGRDGVPPVELLNPDTLIKSFTHFYRQYMAQSLNANFRANFSSFPEMNSTVSVANPLYGTYQFSYTDESHLRLVQSPLSTHILAGILGGLLLCAMTIYFTVDMRKVLPKRVGSIAAIASLLAGSRIVDPDSGFIPMGAEWWSDTKWEKRGIWNGEMFRMGWWDQFGEPMDSWNGKFDGDFNENGDMSKSGSNAVFMIDAKPRRMIINPTPERESTQERLTKSQSAFQI